MLTFQPFNSPHLQILSIIVLCWLIIPIIGKYLMKPKHIIVTSVILALFTFGQEMYMIWFRLENGSFNLTENLPIHLCSFAIYFSSYALVTKNQTAFELSFFWGLAGTIQSLLTPVPAKPFPHIEFLIFFFSHAIIILNVFWMTFVLRMKLRKSSWLRVFVLTNILAIFIGFINWVLDANYMYLCQKPAVNHILLIGNPPFHIIMFEVSAIIFFFILYKMMTLINHVSNDEV